MSNSGNVTPCKGAVNTIQEATMKQIFVVCSLYYLYLIESEYYVKLRKGYSFYCTTGPRFHTCDTLIFTFTLLSAYFDLDALLVRCSFESDCGCRVGLQLRLVSCFGFHPQLT